METWKPYGLLSDLFVHVAGGFEHAVDHVGVVSVAEDLDVLRIIKKKKRKKIRCRCLEERPCSTFSWSPGWRTLR